MQGTPKPWLVRGKFGPRDWMDDQRRFALQHKAEEFAEILKGRGWMEVQVLYAPSDWKKRQ
jgi:hypothetical protein